MSLGNPKSSSKTRNRHYSCTPSRRGMPGLRCQVNLTSVPLIRLFISGLIQIISPSLDTLPRFLSCYNIAISTEVASAGIGRALFSYIATPLRPALPIGLENPYF